MRTADHLLLVTVLVIAFLISMSQGSEATQDSSVQETLNRAVDYLVNNYNAPMGLIPEVPNGTTCWLYSDNFLASYVLGNYDRNNSPLTSLSTNISNTISRYMPSFPDALNQYMVLNSSVWAFNASDKYIIESHGSTVINATFNNGTAVLNSSEYADIAFLKALYFNRTDNATQALIEYQTGINMFNGIGFNDTAFQKGESIGQYQTYKIALCIYVNRILQLEYPQALQTILLKMNASSGGFYSGYDGDFSSNGTSTNTETTCLAILALKDPIIYTPIPEYEALLIILLISTILVVFLKKARSVRYCFSRAYRTILHKSYMLI